MGDENPIRTLADYSRPSHEGYQNTIELPNGNNVLPLRSDPIRLVQKGCSFHGLLSEDPNQHLKDFLKLVDSLDLDVTNRERTRLCESLSKAWTRFKDLLQKVLHYGIDLWLQVQIFYDHVNPTTRRTIDQSADDFAKLVKAISLPQDVPSTSDTYLIKLENQVQRLMEAHLAPKSPVQVNKIASSCKIYCGPHDTQYCMENPEQAFVDYASSRNNEVGGKSFATNQGPRNFNEATNAWKDKPNFNWARTQNFSSPQNGSFSTYSSNIPSGPSSYQTKIEKVLNDFDSHQEKRLSKLGTQLKEQQDEMINKINTLFGEIGQHTGP
ncbi:hypothetical protein Tco_1164714 [Tanacetum coccineum]